MALKSLIRLAQPKQIRLTVHCSVADLGGGANEPPFLPSSLEEAYVV